MSQPETHVIDNAHEQWVSFVLGEEQYAIGVMQVQEVLRPTEITPVAGSPDFVLGIINLRGNVVTVIDARKRFNLPPKEITDDSRIILVEKGAAIVGVLVDRVDQVLNIDNPDIDPTPAVHAEQRSKNVQGVSTRNEALVVIVDLDRLLPEDQLAEAV